MIKQIIFLITAILLLNFVFAIDVCGDDPEITTSCTMITPEITTCSSYTYDIYNNTGIRITNGTLTKVNSTADFYYFNFTEGEGQYIIRLCDGAIREVFVNVDYERYWIYIVAFLLAIALLTIGFKTQDWVYPVLSGMLFIFIAWNIYLNGFPNVTNTFIKEAVTVVLAGLGMYFIIAPIIDHLEERY